MVDKCLPNLRTWNRRFSHLKMFSMFVVAALAVGVAGGDSHHLRGNRDGWQVASQKKTSAARTGRNSHHVERQGGDTIVIQGNDETVTIVQEGNGKEVITIKETHNTSPASGILTESGITISITTETRDLISNSRRRPMSSQGGVTYTLDPNYSFKDTYYFTGPKEIVWNPNTINYLVDDVLLLDDDARWPSVVQSTFNDNLTEVQTVTVTYQTSASAGQSLYNALASKRQELMTSTLYQLGSPIYDTTGSRYKYKTTTNLDDGSVVGPSSQYSGYAWFISNSTGFYSKDLTFRFDQVTNSDYKVYYFDNDTSRVAFEYVYPDPNWPNKQITEQLVYDTVHATQLLEFMQTKFY